MKTHPQPKSGIFAAVANHLRDLYELLFVPNLDQLFEDVFGGQTNEEVRRKIARRAVMRYSRGNVCLQHGRYITKKDVERMRKSVDEFIKYDDDKYFNQAAS